MFKESRRELLFDWSMLGDIADGPPNLGFTTDVTVYRLMQFTLRDVLIKEFGVEATARVFFEAGKSAGRQFYEHMIPKGLAFSEFVNELQEGLDPASDWHSPHRKGRDRETRVRHDGRRRLGLLGSPGERRGDLYLR